MQKYVALDLETTGLRVEEDAIIEVSAIRFQGERVLDTFHSFVNPRRQVSSFIQALTGISPADLKDAPAFSTIAGDLASFLGGDPIVGQRIDFDLGFLAAQGVVPSGPVFDVHDLAAILLPGLTSYRLADIGEGLGISFAELHRATADAMLAKDAFVALLQRLDALDAALLAEMTRVAARFQMPLLALFQAALERKEEESPRDPLQTVRRRPTHAPPPPLTPRSRAEPLDVAWLQSLIGPDGPFAQAIPGYEHRPGQITMLQAVGRALNEGAQLMVEAGTGTGKSLAYLLPASLYAIRNQVPVIISTNTINLQEQLLRKDVPSLLEGLGTGPLADLRVGQLKGRSNYLCLLRWHRLAQSADLSADEGRLVLKVLVWLSQTTSGDRSELNLSSGEARIWDRLCAQSDNCLASHCPHVGDASCFLYAARRHAESSHILIVNHALLLADAAGPGRVLPESSHLIVDEAHHLEEEATRQFGFDVTAGDLWRVLDELNIGAAGLGASRQRRPVRLEPSRDLGKRAEELVRRASDARRAGSTLFSALGRFAGEEASPEGRYGRQVRITRAKRNQAGWADLELAWENLDLILADVEGQTARLQTAMQDLSIEALPARDTLATHLATALMGVGELRRRLENILTNPLPDYVYWLNAGEQGPGVSLCAAPLHVSEALASVFSDKETLVLTSATLSTEGSFAYLKESLGVADADELLLEAPFDYLGSTLLYVPKDIAEPERPGYSQGVAEALLAVARAARGRTLVLFTSHASLQAAYHGLKDAMDREGVQLLGQGIDGSPQQLLRRFRSSPQSLLLGTSSFWEGVDIVGETLSVLVMAKLPFSVPTEPVFAARSETYDEPFQQLALPQAILRFRQGFGRLIRSSKDRGVIVVLDKRIAGKRYGQAFLQSLPPCTVKIGPLEGLEREVEGWLGKGLQAENPSSPTPIPSMHPTAPSPSGRRRT